MSSLGERIRTAREKKNFLQSDLAKLIGVKSSAVISNWEKDLNKPDADKIVRLCDVLDITASYLLDYYGKETFELSLEEEHLLKKYRLLDDFSRETINIIVHREYEHSQHCYLDIEKIRSETPSTPEELEALYPPIEAPKKSVG